MDNLGGYIAVAVLILGILFVARYVRNARKVSMSVSTWCRENGVPDVPFNIEAAVREVVAGTRPGVPYDGQWWAASGLEQVGFPSQTRLLHEEELPNLESVQASIDNLFEMHAGNAILPPHLGEGRSIEKLSSVHPDVIFARITGRHRPIGAWLVAVPPWLISSGK